MSRPIDPATAEQLNERLTYAMGADKSGWDLTQLLRPPGTQNHKYEGAPPVRVKEIRSEAYDPDDLDRKIPSLPEEAREYSRPTEERSTLDEGEPPVVLSPEDFEVWTGKVVKLKDDVSVDRSASLLWIGRVLYDAGATRKTIVAALEERDSSLGWDKYTTITNPDKEYHRIVDELESKGRNNMGHAASALSENGHRQDYGKGGTQGSVATLGERVLLGKASLEGIEPPEELVSDILLAGKIHQIFGDAGIGKSWQALWLTKEVFEQGRSVIYLDTENGKRIFTERLIRALGADPDEVDELLHYYFLPDLPTTPEGKECYVAKLKEVKPALVVFDSWVNFLSGAGLDENLSSDIARWATHFTHPARSMGIAVLILDHVPKEGKNSRGSGRKKEEVDVQWELRKVKGFDRSTLGKLQLKRHKDREGWLPNEVEFSIGGGDDGFVFRRCDKAAGPRRAKLSPTVRRVLEILEERFGRGGATSSQWRKACDEAGISKSTFYRAKNALCPKDDIEPDEPKFVIERSDKYYSREQLGGDL
jgi:hypothetical protein